MTLDFRLKSTNLDGGNGIYNKIGYEIEMNDITGRELPSIETDIPTLYMQSSAIFPTINIGQMKYYPYFGIDPRLKAYSNQPTALGISSQYKLVEQVSTMVEMMFMDNPEILEYAMQEHSEIVVKPNIEE